MSALDTQVGGDHYKSAAIQPVQYIEANDLKFLEGCVVKRVTRHNKPTGKGRQDIEKAIHELQLLLELRYPAVDEPRAFLGRKITQLIPGRVPEGFTEYKSGDDIPPPKTICDVLFMNGDLVCGLEIGHFPLGETAAYRVHRKHPAWPGLTEYRYMFQSSNGQWCISHEKPDLSESAKCWVVGGTSAPIDVPYPVIGDWRDTLIERGADE